MEQKEFKLEDMLCPQCGHSFMTQEGIKFSIAYKSQSGIVILTPIAGDYNCTISLDLPKGESVDFYCGVCGTHLNTEKYFRAIGVSNGRKFEVYMSSIYGEKFTLIIDPKACYSFGQIERHDKVIEKLQKHYFSPKYQSFMG